MGTSGNVSFGSTDYVAATMQYEDRGRPLLNATARGGSGEMVWDENLGTFVDSVTGEIPSQSDIDRQNELGTRITQFVDRMAKSRAGRNGEKLSVEDLDAQINLFTQQYPEVNAGTLRSIINKVSRGVHFGASLNRGID